MRKMFAFLAVALMCTVNLHAQLENTVVQLEIDAPVTVPAGQVTIVAFLTGNSSDPFGPTPPNGDLVFVGGNNLQTQVGTLASASCGLADLTDPGVLGFPASRFYIAGADAVGKVIPGMDPSPATPPLVEDATGLGCIADVDGDGIGDEHTENAYAQTYNVSAPTVVESVLLGIEAATEGNNPLGVDSDGDGVGDSEPIIDGEIPVIVYFFFGTTPSFSETGPIQTPDAEFTSAIIVGPTGCEFAPGDINEDGAVDLLDVSPFVDILTGVNPVVCQADINEDGNVDLLDVAPFVDILTGG